MTQKEWTELCREMKLENKYKVFIKNVRNFFAVNRKYTLSTFLPKYKKSTIKEWIDLTITYSKEI